MKHVRTPLRLRLCGTGEDHPYIAGLESSIAESGLQDRVILEDRWISEDEKAELLSGALACAYVAFDEDSYGYPSLEASHASKPILTTTDSGGVLELVTDGINGFVREPEPAALADAMDRLYLDRGLARRMGQAARDRVREMKINWGSCRRESSGVKILVVTNMAPFVWGGAEELATHLARNLNATSGIQAEILRIPFKWDPPERLIDEMLIARSLRLKNVDQVIGLKFPAYLIPHQHKTIWLVHQYRQAYDLAGTGLSNIPASGRGEELRQAIRSADDICFRHANEIFAIARIPRERLLRYNRLEAKLLPLPLNDAAPFRHAGYGDYIFAGGRIDAGKRQHLLIEAMRHVNGHERIVIGGPPASSAVAEALRALVRQYALEDRVTLDFGFLPREKLVDYVNHALACAYVPVDEDAPGYVTMEAFHASKPVITTSDAGGVLDLVHDGENGWVAAPQPEAIAASIRRMFSNRAKTARMGAAARRYLLTQNVSWERTIREADRLKIALEHPHSSAALLSVASVRMGCRRSARCRT